MTDSQHATPLLVQDVNGRYYEVSTSMIPGDEAANTIILINDVTERQEKDKRVSAILECLPQIAWTAGPEGDVNYFNQGWYSYTGENADDGIRKEWFSIVHPDDRRMLVSRWQEALKHAKPFQQVSRLRRFDGEYRWHLARAHAIFSNTRRIEMWVGSTTDVHDQIALTEELERKVKDRTKLLEESNSELEQFAHISSHDLQEPLRKIQTFADLVMQEIQADDNDSVRRYMDKIITTSARMSVLLKGLLSFTKINQQEPEIMVDLNEVLLHIKEDLELVMVQNSAIIHSDNLPVIRGRPLQIRQLFYNMITNSLKYRKPDIPPEISIRCRKYERGTETDLQNLRGTAHWEIIIKDNGIGFDQAYADQIFTVFQRLHSRSAYEGSGIGLAIASKVAMNHGGRIFAISSIGEGAEFHIILAAGEVVL